MSTRTEKVFMTRIEAAGALGIRPQTLYLWGKRGIGPKPYGDGRYLRYRSADVQSHRKLSHSESVKQGIRRARRDGVPIGRPQSPHIDSHLLVGLKLAGLTVREIGNELGIPSSTVHARIKHAPPLTRLTKEIQCLREAKRSIQEIRRWLLSKLPEA